MTTTHNTNTNPYGPVTILPPKMAFPFPFPQMEMPTTYAGTCVLERSYRWGCPWPHSAMNAMQRAMEDELELEEECENQFLFLDWTCKPSSGEEDYTGYTTHIAMIHDGSDYTGEDAEDDQPLDYLGVAFLRYDIMRSHLNEPPCGFLSYHIPSEEDEPHLIEWYEQGPYDTHIGDIIRYVQRVLNDESAWKPLHPYIDD